MRVEAMRVLELLPEIARRHAAGNPVALATLVDVRGSAPRDPGAAMLVAPNGDLHGSISGGCVEAALVDEAEGVLRERRPRLVEYGISDAQAQSVGLTCGGHLTVLVDVPERTFVAEIGGEDAGGRLLALALRLDEGGRGARLAIFDGGICGTLGSARLDETVAAEIRGGASPARTEIRRYGEDGEPHGEVRVFVERRLVKPAMYVFGAIDFAQAMVRAGAFLGYDVTLCDARSAFATPERFPEASAVIVAWPDDFLASAPVDERTAIVALTHDERFDVPLIRAALQTNAAYIGMMGSRRTTARRMEQLREAGVPEEQLARLSAPIGLDIGARTPEETAIAIAAEIIALRHEREGGRLTGGSGALRGSAASRAPM